MTAPNRHRKPGVTIHVEADLLARLDAMLAPGQTRTDLIVRLITQHVDGDGEGLESSALKLEMMALLAKY